MEKIKFITEKQFLKKYCITNNEKFNVWQYKEKQTTNIEVVKEWYKKAEIQNFNNNFKNNL
jgi:CRISPR/Cas system CSM-associated protein Csm4 (group 5 of RAMP superfamily)